MADSPHSGENVDFDLLLERCDGDIAKAASVLSEMAGIHPRAARDLVERAPTRLVLGVPRADAEKIALAVAKEGLRAEPAAGEASPPTGTEVGSAPKGPSSPSSGSFRRYRRSKGANPVATPTPAAPPSGRFGRPEAEERPRRGTESNRAPAFASTAQAEPGQKSVRSNRQTAFEKTLPAAAMAEAAAGARAGNNAPAFNQTVEVSTSELSSDPSSDTAGREAGADRSALLAARDETTAKAEATGSRRARPEAGVATERTVPTVGGGRGTSLLLQVAVILGLAIVAGAVIGAYFALGG